MNCLPFAVQQPSELDLLRARCEALQDQIALRDAKITALDEQVSRLLHWDREIGRPSTPTT